MWSGDEIEIKEGQLLLLVEKLTTRASLQVSLDVSLIVVCRLGFKAQNQPKTRRPPETGTGLGREVEGSSAHGPVFAFGIRFPQSHGDAPWAQVLGICKHLRHCIHVFATSSALQNWQLHPPSGILTSLVLLVFVTASSRTAQERAERTPSKTSSTAPCAVDLTTISTASEQIARTTTPLVTSPMGTPALAASPSQVPPSRSNSASPSGFDDDAWTNRPSSTKPVAPTPPIPVRAPSVPPSTGGGLAMTDADIFDQLAWLSQLRVRIPATAAPPAPSPGIASPPAVAAMSGYNPVLGASHAPPLGPHPTLSLPLQGLHPAFRAYAPCDLTVVPWHTAHKFQPSLAPQPKGFQPSLAPQPTGFQPNLAPQPTGFQPSLAPQPTGFGVGSPFGAGQLGGVPPVPSLRHSRMGRSVSYSLSPPDSIQGSGSRPTAAPRRRFQEDPRRRTQTSFNPPTTQFTVILFSTQTCP
ncbi:hypothetical protein EDB89DRAFT_2069175 [Lactarius sanguifluus]|nr:hypothetical protein EDB89DRAFT_2069175 [Lactarius sanguifluus]